MTKILLNSPGFVIEVILLHIDVKIFVGEK